jgi:hypothetical protein
MQTCRAADNAQMQECYLRRSLYSFLVMSKYAPMLSWTHMHTPHIRIHSRLCTRFVAGVPIKQHRAACTQHHIGIT